MPARARPDSAGHLVISAPDIRTVEAEPTTPDRATAVFVLLSVAYLVCIGMVTQVVVGALGSLLA